MPAKAWQRHENIQQKCNAPHTLHHLMNSMSGPAISFERWRGRFGASPIFAGVEQSRTTFQSLQSTLAASCHFLSLPPTAACCCILALLKCETVQDKQTQRGLQGLTVQWDVISAISLSFQCSMLLSRLLGQVAATSMNSLRQEGWDSESNIDATCEDMSYVNKTSGWLLPVVFTTLLKLELLQRTFWNNQLLQMLHFAQSHNSMDFFARVDLVTTYIRVAWLCLIVESLYTWSFLIHSSEQGTSARPASKGIRFAQWHPQHMKMRPCALTYLTLTQGAGFKEWPVLSCYKKKRVQKQNELSAAEFGSYRIRQFAFPAHKEQNHKIHWDVQQSAVLIHKSSVQFV